MTCISNPIPRASASWPVNSFSKVLIRNLLKQGHSVKVITQGQSMQPVLPPQTEVIARPFAPPLRLQEIYLYQSGNQLILHRLIKPVADVPDHFYFKGDHPDSSQEQIDSRQILGQVSFNQMDHLAKLLTDLHPAHPESFFHRIRRNAALATGIRKRNQELLSQYQLIKQAFLSQGIKYTPIKGMWLLIQNPFYYSNRLISDMDLLVDRSDLKKAITLLIQLGFKQDPSKDWISKNRIASQSHHLIPFRAPGLSVELHFSAFPKAPKSLIGSLLQSSLVSDHFLVILCHFYRHLGKGDFQEKWLIDLLVLAPDLNLSCLLNQYDLNNLPYSKQLSKLLTIFETWLIEPQEKAHIAARQMKDYIHQHYNILSSHRQGIRELGRNILRFRSLFFTLLPHPDYLRFIDPAQTERPLVLLYLFRWKILTHKVLKILFKPTLRRG